MSQRPSLSESLSELSEELHKVLDPPLLRLLHWMDRQLRRWPWLYRRLES